MAGSQTFDSGSGNWIVENYGTLTAEAWGPGGGAVGITGVDSNGGTETEGTDGTSTTIATLGITANAGSRGRSLANGGSGGFGGSASGGAAENSAGNGGGNRRAGNGADGGASPHGGGTTAGATSPASPGGGLVNCNPGNNGAAPGAGGSGAAFTAGGPPTVSAGLAAGGGGGYSASAYSRNAVGAPSIGGLIAYAVGGNGAGGPSGGARKGGDGGTGRVKFTWTDPAAPLISSVSNNHGSVSGGNTITINGENFIGITSVKFGGTEWAPGSAVINDFELQAVVPAHTSGVVDIVIVGPGGTGTGPALYTYDNDMVLGATDAPDVVGFTVLRSALLTLAATDGSDTAAFTGSLNVFGTLAATEAPDATLIRQQFFDDTDEFVLGGGFPLGAFGENIEGVFFQITEPADVVAIAGFARWELVLNTTGAPDIVNIQGSVYWPLILDATEARDTAAFTGGIVATAIMAATDAPDVAMFIGSTIATAEFETIIGRAHEIDISGRGIEIDLAGVGITAALVGGFGAILSGREIRATLEGRETTP